MSANKNNNATAETKVVKSHHPAPLTFVENLIAGGSAGIIECLIMYPLDVVKTIQQLEVGKGQKTFNVLFDLIKREKFGIYRGIISPLLMETPKRAIKFTGFSTFKPFFQDKNGHVSMLGAMISGSAAGMTEAFVVVPFELVKIRMQARDNVGRYLNSADAVQKIFKQEGAMAFYRGFGSTLWRNGVWNATYFGIIHYWKEIYQPSEEWRTGWRSKFRNFFIGMVGGIVATTFNTPFDVVKSRFQNTPGKPPGTWPSLFKVYKNEGYRALWKGYVPKVLRLGPGGGILFLVFDAVSDMLRKRRGVA